MRRGEGMKGREGKREGGVGGRDGVKRGRGGGKGVSTLSSYWTERRRAGGEGDGGIRA